MKNLLSKVWQTASTLKNWSYDYNLSEVLRLPVPVISIGNLSSGGTGKTPIVQGLCRQLTESGKKVVIVSRNYRATIAGIGRVDLKHPNPALYFGDEPAWLARYCPGAVVYVGPQKFKTALAAFDAEKPDVILVDDGFQHRALGRNLDLVLLDASTAPDIKVLPAGLYRENLTALSRAHFVFLTKVNWAKPDALKAWYALVQDRLPIVEVNFELELPKIETAHVGAFAGLAQSDRFRDLLEDRLHLKLEKFWSFKDHFDYPPMILNELSAWLKENPKRILLTTEKDAVKIGGWLESWPQVKIIPMKIDWGAGHERFFNRLDQIFS